MGKIYVSNTYLCICNHQKWCHANFLDKTLPKCSGGHLPDCTCKKFKLNNLKYLEMLYNERRITMEGKPRQNDPSQPYSVVRCVKCEQQMVLTAQGNSSHKCQK